MKRKSFTLIEMLVTIGILVIILGVSTISLGVGQGSSNVSSQANEIIGLVDELKSFAYGPERERAAHYVLIIQRYDSEATYCNNGLSSDPNKLKKNMYMICARDDKNMPSPISVTALNTGFSRVRAGSLSPDLTITASGFGPGGAFPMGWPIVINIRTYDGQIGYRERYCDTNSYCGTPTMTLNQGGVSKTLTLNSILGTFQ